MAKILVVDDSATQIAQMSKVLQKYGHEILTAEDGAQAVEVTKAEMPDLILMDVVMPNLNGFQATRQITKGETTSHIPVIMLSGKDQETDKLWAERQGASGYFTKPPDEKDLMATIDSLLQA
ncbi:MAG: response regulator [Gammaproteobacteria bacterium]|nr:response regulator [Gammaproteobacteria bacterium]